MSKKAVILDTNIYRAMSYGVDKKLLPVEGVKSLWKEIKEKECSLGIRAFCNPFVLIELLSHLSNPNDPAYGVCKRSVVAAVEHCTIDDQFRYLENGESNMCQILFGKVPEVDRKSSENLIAAVSDIYHDSSDSNIAKHSTLTSQLANHVANMESLFIADIQNFVIKVVGNGKDPWQLFKDDKRERQKFLSFIGSSKFKKQWSLSQVYKAALALEIDIKNVSDLSVKVDNVGEMFSSPFLVYKEILKRLATSGYNLEKDNRTNSVWDMQIMFSFSDKGDIDGMQPVLVTGDKMMREASKSAGLDHLCISQEEYINLIGI